MTPTYRDQSAARWGFANRYGKLDVAPNLHAESLQVAGVLRNVSALSVGTQEQLATLLRLTVAERIPASVRHRLQDIGRQLLDGRITLHTEYAGPIPYANG